MPELPEVETVVRTLEHQIKDYEIEDVNLIYNNVIKNCSGTEFVNSLKHQKFKEFNRRGKWLLFGLSDYILCVHLRMEGKFFVYNYSVQPDIHTECVFKFKNGKELHYNDTRRFGEFHLYKNNEELTCLRNIGPEPWDDSVSADYLKKYCEKKKVPIKAQLLDQKMIAGIGNIYANEICWASKIHPERKSCDITQEEWEEIIKNTRKILELAILSKGTTIRSYTSSLGVTGNNQFNLNIYARGNEKCLRCGESIQYKQLRQRGTFWCPGCQK